MKPFDRVRKVNGVSGMLGTFVKTLGGFWAGGSMFFFEIRDPLFLKIMEVEIKLGVGSLDICKL